MAFPVIHSIKQVQQSYMLKFPCLIHVHTYQESKARSFICAIQKSFLFLLTKAITKNNSRMENTVQVTSISPFSIYTSFTKGQATFAGQEENTARQNIREVFHFIILNCF